jgi:hypothetical protein
MFNWLVLPGFHWWLVASIDGRGALEVFLEGKRLAPLVLVGCGEDAEVFRGSLVVSLAEQVYILVVEDRRGTLNR